MFKTLLTLLLFLIPSYGFPAPYEITTPGNSVGIGSTTPGTTLDVQGTIRASGPVLASSMIAGGSTYTSSSAPPNGMIIQGNVGIGSLAPGQALDVIGNIRSNGSGSSVFNSNIGVGTSLPGSTVAVFGNLAVGSNAFTGIAGPINGLIVSGNVGIGSSVPSVALDVQGSVRSTSFIQTGALFNYFSGNVGVNSISPGQALDIQGTVRISGTIINTGITSDSGKTDATICEDTSVHQFYSGSGTLGICLGTSTRDAKQNIHPISEGINEILSLKPVSFSYKPGWGFDPNKPYYGFLAEDVEKVLPRLVGHNQKGEVRSADYVGMIPVLVKAVQQLQDEIKDIKNKTSSKE